MELSTSDEILSDGPPESLTDSVRGTSSDGPLIMNAIRDAESGEMVATDVISASRVVARFRNVAERSGYVSIGFDVMVPCGLSDSRWQLRINPYMTLNDGKIPLESVYITGDRYRASQMRGYERYRRFLASIVTDTTEFVKVHQLEIFLMRHFPDTYAMKTDSSFVSDPMAESLFGVTQREALEHYRKSLKEKLNEGRAARRATMFRKYVKDPIKEDGVRLDTVIRSMEGDFIYRYTHTFKARPGLKKAVISLDGGLYEDGKPVVEMTFPEDITFYISSLSSLVDEIQKYRFVVLERRAYDMTKALIDFSQGSSKVDTMLGDNLSELARIRRCIGDISARKEYVLDSLVIMASCSPEGSFELNRRLSIERSEAVREYICSYVPESWRDSLRVSSMPENWEQLRRLVRNDTILGTDEKQRILSLAEAADQDPDRTERAMSRMPHYRYLREKIYPKLRSVSFEFHMSRVGMEKDTVHTTEPDTVYMSGLMALKELDYKKAVLLLRPYADYNSALAFMSAGYNHSALDVLNGLDDSQPKVCYLKSMVLARLGMLDEALKYFCLSVAHDPSMRHRANLDPEMYLVLEKYATLNINQ